MKSFGNTLWFQNLKLPHRAGGYKVYAHLMHPVSTNPYDWGAPLLNGKQRYERYVIKKQ